MGLGGALGQVNAFLPTPACLCWGGELRAMPLKWLASLCPGRYLPLQVFAPSMMPQPHSGLLS